MGTLRKIKKHKKKNIEETSKNTVENSSIEILLLQVNSLLSKFRKEIFIALGIIFLFIIVKYANFMYINNKVSSVSEALKAEKYNDLKDISPDLFELYEASNYQYSDTNESSKNLLISYLKTIDAKNFETSSSYLTQDKKIFSDIIAVSSAFEAFKKDDIVIAKKFLKQISNESKLKEIKIELNNYISIKENLIKDKND